MLPYQVHKVEKTEQHVARVRASQARERSKLTDPARSPRWPAARRKHLRSNPSCAACGSRVGVQVHHEKPFHLRPDLELDPGNLISLCEFVGGLECHEMLGHGGNWKKANPNVRVDAAELLAHPEILLAIRARAKRART